MKGGGGHFEIKFGFERFHCGHVDAALSQQSVFFYDAAFRLNVRAARKGRDLLTD